MLENIGFKYINEIDPFDGGPHYRSKLNEIKPIKELIKLNKIVETPDEINKRTYLINLQNNKFEFCALRISGEIIGNLLLVSPEDFALIDKDFEMKNINLIKI
jgi:arginine N-succinyltransferase